MDFISFVLAESSLSDLKSLLHDEMLAVNKQDCEPVRYK